MTRKRKRRLATDTTLFVAGMGAVAALGRVEPITRLVADLGRPGWEVSERAVFNAALYGGLLILCVLGTRLLFGFFQRVGHVRSIRGMRLGQIGGVTVEFTLVLPVYVAVYGGVTQLALMANASLMIDYAAYQAARTAIVYYERPSPVEGEEVTGEGETKARRAAAMCLAPISPRAAVQIGNADDASTAANMQAALNRGGNAWANTMPERMAYALAPGVIDVDLDLGPPRSGWSWEHINIIQAYGDPTAYYGRDPHEDTDILPLGLLQPPREIRATVTYQFKLQIPGISAVLAPNRQTFGGLTGRYVDIKAACDLQATAGRRGSVFNLLGGLPLG